MEDKIIVTSTGKKVLINMELIQEKMHFYSPINYNKVGVASVVKYQNGYLVKMQVRRRELYTIFSLEEIVANEIANYFNAYNEEKREVKKQEKINRKSNQINSYTYVKDGKVGHVTASNLDQAKEIIGDCEKYARDYNNDPRIFWHK